MVRLVGVGEWREKVWGGWGGQNWAQGGDDQAHEGAGMAAPFLTPLTGQAGLLGSVPTQMHVP